MFFYFRRGAEFLKKGDFSVSWRKLGVYSCFKHRKRQVFHFHMDAEMVAFGQGFADAVDCLV